MLLLVSLALLWLLIGGVVLVFCVGMLRAGHKEDVDRHYLDD